MVPGHDGVSFPAPKVYFLQGERCLQTVFHTGSKPKKVLSCLAVRGSVVLALLAIPLGTFAGLAMAEDTPDQLPRPSASEALAPVLSLARAGEFLDAATLAWTGEKKCGSCHTSYPYL